MIGSMERLGRHVRMRSVIPVAMLVVGVHAPTDPTRRETGYMGVLPVPVPAATSSVASREPVADQGRRDVRAARGRVLYAAGHVPRVAEQRAERKAVCPERRVGQTKPAESPNS